MSKIYDNQKRTATIMFDRWRGKRKPILLVAQCQSGKTGAMLGLCDELIKMENNFRFGKATKELPGIIVDCTRPHKDYVYSYNLLKDYEQYDHINAPCVGKFLVVKFKKYNSKKVYTNNSSYAK